MHDYLVDVPVKVTIWIRPEMQRQQFEVIKKARPSVLFVASDGGRNDDEWEKIRLNRKMYDEEIDWNCQIYKLYQDKNIGMYSMIKETQKLIWSKADRCLLLEDDIIPSVSYFRFCAEMLEKYKDDQRIFMVCGVNDLGVSENVRSDYFFSKYGAIQGCALWKRSFDQFYDYAFKDDPYIMEQLKKKTGKCKVHWKEIESVARTGVYDGHVPADEFFCSFACYGQNQLMIIPKKNLLCNVGVGSDAEHGDTLKRLPRAARQFYYKETYELEFPLKHAKYVIPDEHYEEVRKRILGVGHPALVFFRKIERLLLVLADFDFAYVAKKIKKKIQIKSGKLVEK